MSAGLGLKLYDQNVKETTHKVVVQWLKKFKKDFCTINEETGLIEKILMYFDPSIEHMHYLQDSHKLSSGIGWGLVWYLLPQNSALAFRIYDALVLELKLRELDKPLEATLITAKFLILPFLLAKEFSDDAVVKKLKHHLNRVSEGKHFGTAEFGFFFHLGEDWPRGQFSALLMCGEVLTPGDWQRAFYNAGNKERFHAPTVEEIAFPDVGVSQAWNDTEHGFLVVSLYVANPLALNQPTTFKISGISSENREAVTVQCEGQTFTDWQWKDNIIEISTHIAEKQFLIYTGHKNKSTMDTFIPITVQNADTMAKL